MDNSVDGSTAAWSTPRAAGLAMAGGGLILLVAAVVVGDPVGALMLGVAGVLLLAFAAAALLIRPRLAVVDVAGQTALRIRTITGAQVYPPERIDRIRVLDFRRVGRRSGHLEFDLLHDDAPTDSTDDLRDDVRLVVFGRWDLGTDVRDVAEELRLHGFDVEDARDSPAR